MGTVLNKYEVLKVIAKAIATYRGGRRAKPNERDGMLPSICMSGRLSIS